METNNLYVNGKQVLDIIFIRNYHGVRVLLKGNANFVHVPYEALTWVGR